MAKIAAMYDPLDAGRSLGDSRQSLSSTKVTKLEDLLHALQAWENLEQRHQERSKGHRALEGPPWSCGKRTTAGCERHNSSGMERMVGACFADGDDDATGHFG